jgi:hypothetical protein
MEQAIKGALSVDKLTEYFNAESYLETKYYLTIRHLILKDKRFKQISLIYKDKNRVDTIIWDITISFSQLTEIFGEPIIHNEPYSDSTAFAFKSSNKAIIIIQTRYPEWLTMEKSKSVFEYQDKDNRKIELANPEFSFIQFKLFDDN